MKRTFVIVAAFVLALCMPALAFGAGGNGSGGGGGNGSGGGTGGGSAEPLVVKSASIEDGAQINAGDSITLVFSKNVCEASVREANKELASVKDSQEADVSATVVLADDQVEPDKKNDMVIMFDTPLPAGTYTLTAKAGITSKSGDVLAEDYVLHFSVASAEPPASASAPAASASASAPSSAASAGASSAAASTSASSTAASASASSASSASNSSATNQQGGSDLVLPIAIGVIAIVVIAGVVVVTKKKK